MPYSITRYAAGVPLRNKEAATCVDALIEKWISAFGCPEEIHSDQGREFVNSILHDLYRRLEIQKMKTSSIHLNQTQLRGFIGLSIPYLGSISTENTQNG